MEVEIAIKWAKKNAEQRCSAENKIKKLCVEQKKGDNKTDVKSNKLCSISLTSIKL